MLRTRSAQREHKRDSLSSGRRMLSAAGKPLFCGIPQEDLLAVMRCRFTATELRLILAILYRQWREMDHDGQSQDIGFGGFVQFTKMARRDLQRARDRLEERGVIAVGRPGPRRRINYRVNPPGWWDTAHYPEAGWWGTAHQGSGSTPTRGGGAQPTRGGGSTPTTVNQRNQETKENQSALFSKEEDDERCLTPSGAPRHPPDWVCDLCRGRRRSAGRLEA